MLAPRKTLWSTPNSALEYIEKWINLQPGDCVCDIGCGDGRIILQWAERYCYNCCSQQHSQHTNHQQKQKHQQQIVSFIGIDIDQERIKQCQISLQEAYDDEKNGTISKDLVDIQFICANALESSEIYEKANIFFLYLIPRGLKIFYPILLEQKKKLQQQQHDDNNNGPSSLLRVVTYMSKLPGETPPTDRGLCKVEHQPGAEWPLYYYNL